VQASVGVDPAVTVINNSPELSADLRRALPSDVRIVDMETNEGFAGGANAALRDWYANLPLAELAVIGAHDMHVDVSCLAALVAASRARSDYGVVGPIMTQPFTSSGGTWTRRGGRQVPLSESTDEPFWERDWISGTCMLWRKECALDVGGFDIGLKSYCEDLDVCLRAREKGWKVGVTADATAWGLGSASPNALALVEANTVRVIRRHEGVYQGLLAEGRLLASCLRSLAGTVAVWRPRGRRLDSRHQLSIHVESVRIAFGHHFWAGGTG
jgi:GT2 family glycosyltransferase